jgi:hypothetical protein
MKPSKERPWIGTRKGKGGKGDLDIRGEDLSTMRHLEKGKSWNDVKKMAGNRTRWPCYVDALCPLKDNKN